MKVVMSAALILLAIFLSGESHASGNIACEIEVLSEGGRAFVGVLRAGLNNGDLTDSHLNQILQMSSPSSPQLGERPLWNHAFRLGFARSLKHIKKEEWPSVLATITRVREERVKNNSLVEAGQEATKAIFNIKATGQVLDVNVEYPKTFVTAKGEVFVFLKTKTEQSILWNFQTGQKTFLPTPSEHEPEFFETSSGQVLVSYLWDTAKMISVFDVRKPEHPYYELDLTKVEGLKPYVEYSGFKDAMKVSTFEINGYVKVAYHPSQPFVMHGSMDPEMKMVVIVDLSAGAHYLMQFPNINLAFGVAGDGRFYAAGAEGGEQFPKSYFFLRDVLLEKDVYRHDYEGKEGSITALNLQLLSESSGKPAIYLGHGCDAHGKVTATSKEMERVDPCERPQAVSFRDRNGRFLHADRSSGVYTKTGFHIGERGKYKNYSFPTEGSYGHLHVTEGNFGEFLMFSLSDPNGSIQALHFFERASEQWIRLPVTKSLNLKFNLRNPFFDAKSKRILGFAQTRDDRWILLQYFGEQDE